MNSIRSFNQTVCIPVGYGAIRNVSVSDTIRPVLKYETVPLSFTAIFAYRYETFPMKMIEIASVEDESVAVEELSE